MTTSEILALLSNVSYEGHIFTVGMMGDASSGIPYLQIVYNEKDVETGEITEQRGRKWHISSYATPSEIVQTALKAALTSAEHRVREHFRYKGKRIFGPHFDIEALVKICDEGQVDVRVPPEKKAKAQETCGGSWSDNTNCRVCEECVKSCPFQIGEKVIAVPNALVLEERPGHNIQLDAIERNARKLFLREDNYVAMVTACPTKDRNLFEIQSDATGLLVPCHGGEMRKYPANQ